MPYQMQKMEDVKKSLTPANSRANFNVILITIMKNGMKSLWPSPVLITFYERFGTSFHENRAECHTFIY